MTNLTDEMAFVENEGARLYWHAFGSGPPVLLIMGLSFTHEMWFRVVPHLSDYRIILFDNRGMGRSSVPNSAYSMAMMARDAAAVLQAAGESSAHVVGASMGGMIAQELALSLPEKVRSLALACTSHGGMLARWPKLRYVPLRQHQDRYERERAVTKLIYADSTPPQRIAEDMRVRCACGWSGTGFVRQLCAVLPWTSYLRLPKIQVPTLVAHGDQDRLIPPVNGRTVANRIPNADFHLIENAGHIFMTDQPERSAEILRRFLGQQ